MDLRDCLRGTADDSLTFSLELHICRSFLGQPLLYDVLCVFFWVNFSHYWPVANASVHDPFVK